MNTQTPTPTLPTTHIETQKSKIENDAPTPSPLLPIGHLTLLLGNPGVGKSLLATDFAARLTTNSLPPPHPSLPRPPVGPQEYRTRNLHPGTIIYLSTEDSIHTLDARLTAAGALDEFILCPPEKLPLHYHDENSEHPQFPEALKRGILPPPLIRYLADFLDKIRNPRLLILDPLPSFLGLKDSSNAALIRRLLDPLLSLAQSCRFSVLGLSHLSKSAPRHTPHLLRSLGSIAYTALARSVLLLEPDPHNPTRRHLHQIKSNLSEPHPSLAFTITSAPPIENRKSKIENPQEAPTLTWDPDPLPNSQSLSFSPSISEEALLRSQLDDAIDFLKTTLTEGPLPSAQLQKESRSLGINPRTLSRAKFLLNIHSRRDPHTRQWLTILPTHTPDPQNPV